MDTRQAVSIDTIKDRLLAQLDGVIDRYTHRSHDSYRDHQGREWRLNPGRPDRHVGSFHIATRGPKAGMWFDHATGEGGDVIDLIRLSLSLNLKGALAEARAFLGLATESPELRRAREQAAAAARARRQAAEQAEAARLLKRQKAAQALWLSAQERIAGTPVEAYLRGRGIDLSALGRQPRALRYHPACAFHGQETVEEIDAETGEVRPVTRNLPPVPLPAMLAAITDARGAHVATHRTYLGIAPDGVWRKVRGAAAKKVLGSFAGAAIRLWSGAGPKGGKGPPLSHCPPGTRLYIAEGIETALSVVVLRPEARVLAAVSLSNMGGLALPANVAEVVLVADGDEGAEAQAALARAVAAHARAGRLVRLVAAPPGQDLNDRLQAAQAQGMEGAA